MARRWVAGAWLAAMALCVQAAAGEKTDSDIEAAAVKGLTLPPGVKAQLWSSGRQVTNPVSICFDEKNRLYAAATFRFREGGGLDIRSAGFMYFDDFKAQTVADRRATYEKYKSRFKPDYFTKNKEKIFVLEDVSGSGKAEKSGTFAEAFNDSVDGPGVGIAHRDGRIQYACIPKIWELSDTKGTGAADKQTVLADGFGVHVGISGHDLHGLIWGPDGKLYFSMGDRGYNVQTREGKTFAGPYEGGVFRCNPDGSDFEVYYYGLRNPQELAFDDYGNLFTCDNNADIGDKARLAYILEGGSSGWTSGWQLLKYADFGKLAGLGGQKPDPWLDEGMWKMSFPEQPQHILPPAGLVTSGPCGMAFYPGTGFADGFARHFFVCDYTAGTQSGIHSFIAEESGAGFAIKDAKKCVWGVTATDVDFGYDGKMYICDYGGGWSLSGKGRIFTAFNAETIAKPEIVELQKLFAAGIGKLNTTQLSELLKHADMRARQQAQFELAKRGKEGLAALNSAAKSAGHLHARLHGVWGLGQLARGEPDALTALRALLRDGEARVREQAAKMLGDARCEAAGAELAELLIDANPRVKTLAAIAIGRIRHAPATAALIQILRDNDNKDLFLRHGAMMGLAGIGKPETLESYVGDASRGVRLGVLLALRRMKDARAGAFLKDSDALIYAEAIRAIYDTPIPQAMGQLQAQLQRLLGEPALAKTVSPLNFSRVLHATSRFGTPEQGVALAKFAADKAMPENARLLALELVEKWSEPTDVDPVTGLYRPVGKRAKLEPNDGLRAALKQIIEGDEGAVAAKAVDMAMAFGVELSDEALLKYLKNTKGFEALRISALKQLVQRQSAELTTALPVLLKESAPQLRIAALDAALALDPAGGVAAAEAMLDESEPPSNDIKVAIDKSTTSWGALKMGPPSRGDFADKSAGHGVVFSTVNGFNRPHALSGPDGSKLPRLNDGGGAENDDDVERCVWLDGNEARFTADLTKEIEIAAINTYSWHRENRAPQKFTLWGAAGEKMPNAGSRDLPKEWTKIAAVDTTSLRAGGMHGSSVAKSGGVIGKYRWLLWQDTRRGPGTFFTEIDIFEKGQPRPVNSAQIRLKQQVLLALGKAKTDLAAGALAARLDSYDAGKVPAEAQLELFEAAEMRPEKALSERIARYKAAIPESDKPGPFRTALAGGDAAAGEEVFRFNAGACMRCHKIGADGGEAGPALTGVGKRLTREKLLESIVEPNAVIVPGFGTAMLRMQDGMVYSGGIVKEDAKELSLKQSDETTITLSVPEIKRRAPATSPMPAMESLVKVREMRDLIEYLWMQQ